MRTYSELIKLESYDERLRYLQLLDGNVDSPRDISMGFYKSKPWRDFREAMISRDDGFDLGVKNLYIYDRIIVHHINPITAYDIINMTDKLIDPENVIITSGQTHNIIHYGSEQEPLIEREPGDTILW